MLKEMYFRTSALQQFIILKSHDSLEAKTEVQSKFVAVGVSFSSDPVIGYKYPYVHLFTCILLSLSASIYLKV